MELFTRNLEFSYLKYVLAQKFNTKNERVEVFPETPGMTFYNFTVGSRTWRLVIHLQAQRFGFSGTSLKVELKDYNHDADQELSENFAKKLAESLGGILVYFGGDYAETFEEPGEHDTLWMLKRMLSAGYDEDELSELLESKLNEFEQTKERRRGGH